MNRGQLLTLTITLVLLAGAGVGGWFAGAKLLATQPEEPAALAVDAAAPEDDEDAGAAAGVAGRVRVGYDPSANINTALVLGAAGLSPFGQPEGLRGRQVLAGRIVELREERREIETASGLAEVMFHAITLKTSSGTTTISIRADSTFLLRLGGADPAAIAPGAAVALILEESDGGRATAVAGLVLPADARPVLNPGLPVVGDPPPEAEE